MFDPRLVPVMVQANSLPRVVPSRLTAAGLSQHFKQMAGHSWHSEPFAEKHFIKHPLTEAAVLFLLVRQPDDSLSVLLTQRSAQLSTHSGQIAFAGGKRDPKDAHVEATALREAQEEIGLQAQHVEVLGRLPQHETGTGFRIHPIVALVAAQHTLVLHPSAAEVSAIFTVPLHYLMQPVHHELRSHFFQGHQREWFSVAYQDGDVERFIWGATAGMIRNLYRFLIAEPHMHQAALPHDPLSL